MVHQSIQSILGSKKHANFARLGLDIAKCSGRENFVVINVAPPLFMKNSETNNTCTYCGFEGNIQREHVIPAVWYEHRSKNDLEQWIVPACGDCNILAGSAVFFSIPEKAKYILKRYRSKYRSLLNVPFWSEEELKQVKRMLRLVIEDSMLRKHILLRRIQYLEHVTNYSSDYLRPKWVERDMEEMMKEYIKIKKYLSRKNETQRIQKKKNNPD